MEKEQASVALMRSQNQELIGNSSFMHYILVKEQGKGLGWDISFIKIVRPFFFPFFDKECNYFYLIEKRR